MADENFDPCKCISNHEIVMQRLLYILRQSQDYCTDTECSSVPQLPESRNVLASPEFFMACLLIAFGIMYALSTNSLHRLRNDKAKDRDNGRDSNDDPPTPPPTAL